MVIMTSMMEPHCKNCRWWYWPNPADDDPVNVRLCNCPKIEFSKENIGWESANETRLMVANDDEHVLSGDEAAVCDGSGYIAKFLPGPDFGCIHFVAKDEVPHAEYPTRPFSDFVKKDGQE